ncbi:CHASE2 domain-containing protein [Nostoc favosum]|uniref:CHASE2 domain-containing protein n=1 Tax=Nostoc favosum CHAB5714 TaxID=2780399 RepID=A0ABS8IJ15_9NOSO|nr:CHASE2 domain-containing protein [Nostoc favosum]MCC5603809.1 CHASE2 domain-containing protein [Nostoc favosum CHAB5714]
MTNLYLKVQRIEQVCLFELSWGTTQRLSAKTSYPENLTLFYQEWQRNYLSFYKNLSSDNNSLRGRVESEGSFATPPVDWQAKLVQAEAKFLLEFHKWLRSGDLYEIRQAITQAAFLTKNSQSTKIKFFITCDAVELAHLPWESWEICTESAFSPIKINVVRTPINISQKLINQHHICRGKARVLVILGDDTGLNFEAEKKAIADLKNTDEVKFVGWQSGKDINELKAELKTAIASQRGWDILLFAGHSNETVLTGGEVGIAPNNAISISEIAPLLNIAIAKGLKFALFNSCNGLSIANTLIDLGFSQVAIMREPIHNKVASKFLLQLLKALGEYKDVQEALISACQYLKLEDNLKYPSAYLIPSLFLHPEASLFRFQPGINDRLQKILPSRLETVVLSALFIVSTQLPIQKSLLEQRLKSQAIYRQLIGQVQSEEKSHKIPPVLLVQIDEESIRKAKVSHPRPMDRKVIAQLVDKAREKGAKVIGIDFLLDRYQGKNDEVLANSLQTAVNSSQPTWFVLATTSALNGEPLKVIPEIAKCNWSLQGEIEVLPGYLPLFSSSNEPECQQFKSNQSQAYSFSSLLALSHQLEKATSQLAAIPKQKRQGVISVSANTDETEIQQVQQPKLDNKNDLIKDIYTFIKNNKLKNNIFQSPRVNLQPLTEFSYRFGQMWLHPIIDFSISPNQIYHTIPAWQFWENNSQDSTIFNLQNQIVIIAPGGYGEAGMSKDGEDNFDLPPAVKQWRLYENPNNVNEVFTGGEIHAYNVHHYLNQRFIIPIPDLWMILLAAFIGKSLYFLIKKNPRLRSQFLLSLGAATAIYGILSLQIYLWAIAILLPWLLPSLTVWFYIISAYLTRETYE